MQIPLGRIGAHLASGRLHGVAVSATRVATGAAVTFYQAAKLARPWHAERNMVPVPTQITRDHVLASAAIPLLFPPVAIDGDTYMVVCARWCRYRQRFTSAPIDCW